MRWRVRTQTCVAMTTTAAAAPTTCGTGPGTTPADPYRVVACVRRDRS